MGSYLTYQQTKSLSILLENVHSLWILRGLVAILSSKKYFCLPLWLWVSGQQILWIFSPASIDDNNSLTILWSISTPVFIWRAEPIRKGSKYLSSWRTRPCTMLSCCRLAPILISLWVEEVRISNVFFSVALSFAIMWLVLMNVSVVC